MVFLKFVFSFPVEYLPSATYFESVELAWNVSYSCGGSAHSLYSQWDSLSIAVTYNPRTVFFLGWGSWFFFVGAVFIWFLLSNTVLLETLPLDALVPQVGVRLSKFESKDSSFMCRMVFGILMRVCDPYTSYPSARLSLLLDKNSQKRRPNDYDNQLFIELVVVLEKGRRNNMLKHLFEVFRDTGLNCSTTFAESLWYVFEEKVWDWGNSQRCSVMSSVFYFIIIIYCRSNGFAFIWT